MEDKRIRTLIDSRTSTHAVSIGQFAYCDAEIGICPYVLGIAGLLPEHVLVNQVSDAANLGAVERLIERWSSQPRS